MLGLGFFALLRTGELLNVTASDILLNDSMAIVSLHNTKTGQKDNVSEMVQFDDGMTLEVLRAVIAMDKADNFAQTPLWRHSAQLFRTYFKKYCIRFHLLRHKFRPYSLRRGGATWLFQSSGSMELALLKGRWSSNRVARIYISDALSYVPGLTFSPKAQAHLAYWDPFSTL